MSGFTESPAPDEPADVELLDRLVVVLFELNLLLSLAAGRGLPVTLDLVERENPRAPGTTYQEVVDTGGVP